VQNLPGYLLSAVKHNYQPAKTKENKVVELSDTKLEVELAALKRQIEVIRSDYAAYREKFIHATIESLTADDKKRFMDEFYNHAEVTINTILQLQRHKYSRETVINSPQIKALLRRFAVRELDLMSVLSLEEFVARLEEQKVEAWQKFKSYDPDHPLLSGRVD
jgi:hypothetical protein